MLIYTNQLLPQTTGTVKNEDISGIEPLTYTQKYDNNRQFTFLLPCHLGVVYEFLFALWWEPERWLATWRDAEGCGTWSEVESCFLEEQRQDRRFPVNMLSV